MSLRDYIGIPYEVRGEPPHGADCYSLVKHYALHELSKYLPPYMYAADDCYARASVYIHEAETQMVPGWKKVECQPGAVAVFRVMGLVMHCGIMVNESDFLHAFEGRNSTVESLHDFYWAKRVQGFFIYE